MARQASSNCSNWAPPAGDGVFIYSQSVKAADTVGAASRGSTAAIMLGG
jgi:hypothetical protein